MHARRNAEYDACGTPIRERGAEKAPTGKVVGELGQVVLNATCFLQEDITLARERDNNRDLASVPGGGHEAPSVASEEAGGIPRPKKRSMKRMRDANKRRRTAAAPAPCKGRGRSALRGHGVSRDGHGCGETSEAGMISRMVTFSAAGLSSQRTVRTVQTELLARSSE